MTVGEPSSFASLGPTLLARKGGAKPAMRPQVAPLAGGQAAALAIDPEELEDLGWNDMGHEGEHHEAQILALTPLGKGEPALEEESDDELAAEPEVRRQQREIVAAIAEPRAPARPRVRRVANDVARRAAFTLRLDATRHLKLRLATTLKGKSAQALVTQALDQFLAAMPDIETLAAQMKRDGQ